VTTVDYYQKRRNYQDCLEQLYSLRHDTKEPGWDMGEAKAISEHAFNNAIFLIGRIQYERTPEVQVSTDGNLGLLFNSYMFPPKGVDAVLTIVVVLREDEIKLGVLFRDRRETNTGFQPASPANLKKIAEYISRI